jgi:hypothetical protein
MATLRTTCERAGLAAGRFSFRRTSSEPRLHISLPDSLTSQAVTAPPVYAFCIGLRQESSKTTTAAFLPASTATSYRLRETHWPMRGDK